MTQSREAPPVPNAHSRTAVGSLTLLVEDGNGTEKVTYERRWPDSATARAWCEGKVRGAGAGAVVLEIQVTEEIWGQANPWDATGNRQIPDSLQLGMRQRTGEIVWGTPRRLGEQLGRRRHR